MRNLFGILSLAGCLLGQASARAEIVLQPISPAYYGVTAYNEDTTLWQFTPFSQVPTKAGVTGMGTTLSASADLSNPAHVQFDFTVASTSGIVLGENIAGQNNEPLGTPVTLELSANLQSSSGVQDVNASYSLNGTQYAIDKPHFFDSFKVGDLFTYQADVGQFVSNQAGSAAFSTFVDVRENLTAVPEPGPLALLAAGSLAVGGWLLRGRRRRLPD
jgi:hypothetical protein